MQECLGKVDPLMIKAVGPMAGGSRVGSLCGALQGGILTLGMLYGAEGENLSSQEALVESFQPVKRFYREFEKTFGSRNCPEIIHADLENPEERKKWVDRGGPQECARLCGQTVRLLSSVIRDFGETK
jgi:C_GCAxxG_C_C family probable redox protein